MKFQPTIRSVNIVGILVAAVVGFCQAWQYRFHNITADILSYQDMGDALLRGDWVNGVNGYWSPLYPLLLAVTAKLLPVPPYWMMAQVKAVNLVIYGLAVFAFVRMMSTMQGFYTRQLGDNPDVLRISGVTLQMVMWIVFLYGTLVFGGTYIETPDMLVTTIILAVTSPMMRIWDLTGTTRDLIVASLLISLGYLAKAYLFSLCSTYSFMVACTKNWKMFLLGTAIYYSIAAPWIVALSMQTGHLTFSEVYKVGKAWVLCDLPIVHAREPEFVHPTRKIFDKPVVYEFAEPLNATYSPWFNPVYWYEGFNTDRNIEYVRVFTENVIVYLKTFLGLALLAALAAGVIVRRMPFSIKSLWKNAPILIPAGAGFASYSIAANFPLGFCGRYVSAFVVLIFAGLLLSLRLPNDNKGKLAARVVSLIIGGTLVLSVIQNSLLWCVGAFVTTKQNWSWQVANELNRLGIKSGDYVCHIGTANYYWAKVGGVRITADIESPNDFWSMTDDERKRLFDKLREFHIKAIVQDPELPDSHRPTVKLNTNGGIQVKGTDSWIFPINQTP